MQKLDSEPCVCCPDAEIRLGYASWDKGERQSISVKFTWFDKRGYACRGGEVPVEALPQMVAVAIKNGYLTKATLENCQEFPKSDCSNGHFA